MKEFTATDHQSKDKVAPPTDLRDLLGLLRPTFNDHKTRLAIGFIALLAVDLLQLTIPRLIKHGVDGLSDMSISQYGLVKLGGFILLIASCVVVLRFSWRYLIIGFSRILEKDIRNRLFNHLLRLDSPFYSRHTTGELMAHFSNDLSAIQMACGMGMVAAVDALVMSSAAIGFMIAIHPKLTLLALLPMPILIVSTRILSGKLHRRFATVQEQFSALTEFSRSTLLSIGLIKAYTMEKLQTDQFDSLGSRYIKANLRVATIQGLISPMASMVGSLGMLMVLYFGGSLVISKSISLGDFVAFITYLYMLIWPMMAIGWVTNLVQRGRTSLNRIALLIESQPMLPDGSSQESTPENASPTYSLRNLSFTYPGASQQALHEINLEIGPGIHGVTGRTGSGKSTLCKLLTRLFPVEDGQLIYSGIDINRLALERVRSDIGYVGQEPILFSDTIAANIGYGKADATDEEIVENSKLSGIHDDISDFPEQYQTLIGERGVKLSGGQRQRLTLARALLCKRPVLIIDDGLSAVDVETEHEVFDNLRTIFTEKTVIIVSNRIKLLSVTDRVIILDEGKIDCIGTHQQLLKQSDLYKTMHEKQMAESYEEVSSE